MAEFDRIAGTYDNELKTVLGFFGKNNEKFAIYKVNLLSHLLKKTKIKKILDFGCGIGRSIKYLHKFFPDAQVYGCDLSEAELNIAKRAFPEDYFFVNEKIESIRNYGKFDLIFVACVFHHIPPSERNKWSQAILQALNKGGYVAIFEHNIKNPKTKSIILDPRNTVDNIKWMLTKKDLKQLFTSPELNILTKWQGYTLFSPIRPRWITNLERVLYWLPLGAQHALILKKS